MKPSANTKSRSNLCSPFEFSDVPIQQERRTRQSFRLVLTKIFVQVISKLGQQRHTQNIGGSIVQAIGIVMVVVFLSVTGRFSYPVSAAERDAAIASCTEAYGDDQAERCACTAEKIAAQLPADKHDNAYEVIGMTYGQQLDYMLGDSGVDIVIDEAVFEDVLDLMAICGVGETDPSKDK